MADWYVVSGEMCACHAYKPKSLYKTNVMVFANNADNAKSKAVLHRYGFSFIPDKAKKADGHSKYVVSEEVIGW